MAGKYREFTVEVAERLKKAGYEFISTDQQVSSKDVGFEAGTEFAHFLVIPFMQQPEDIETMRIDSPEGVAIAEGIDLVYHWVDAELLTTAL
jgi:hypothetical protein